MFTLDLLGHILLILNNTKDDKKSTNYLLYSKLINYFNI